jgi:hypothetical protein
VEELTNNGRRPGNAPEKSKTNIPTRNKYQVIENIRQPHFPLMVGRLLISQIFEPMYTAGKETVTAIGMTRRGAETR